MTKFKEFINEEMTAVVDGKTVKVGDVVGFKSDFEQYGKIIKIAKASYGRGTIELTLQSSSDSGFDGEYIKGDKTTVERAEDCWID